MVEVDGTGATASNINGITFANSSGSIRNVVLNDIYIHDLQQLVDNATGLYVYADSDSTINAELARITVSNIVANGNAFGLAFFSGINSDFTPGNLNVNASNSTVNGIISTTTTAGAIAATQAVVGGEAAFDGVFNNVTISEVDGVPGVGVNYGEVGISIAGAAIGAQDEVNMEITVTNSLIGDSASCGFANINSLIGGSGTVNSSYNSGGGNITSHETCGDIFTEPTDVGNLNDIDSTLDPLASNSGGVPTMALLQGSPAIDAGITVAGLTTDARGEARPQGLAYDSGAYESPFTRPASVSSNQDTLADTGESRIVFLSLSLLLVFLPTAFLLRRRIMLQ
jgi:hypothetical protein